MEKSFLHKTGITGVMVFISLCFSACNDSSKFLGTGMHFSNPDNLSKIVSHDLERFEPEHFRDPDSFYWPAYFWFWNDTISREIITKQLTDMYSHGARSVCLHPLPRGVRPYTMFTRMEPDYLTPEYFGFYRYAIEECHRLGMKCYLYDER